MTSKQLYELGVADWRAFCTELHLNPVGRKAELRPRVLAYLQSEEGRRRVHNHEASQRLQHLGTVLNLQRPEGIPSTLACLCAGAVRGGDLIRCTQCATEQHRKCVGNAALMPQYYCARCHMQSMEPLQPVLEVIFAPISCLAPGQSPHVFPYRNADREAEVQIRSVRIDQSGYLQRWPHDCAIVINNVTVEEFRSDLRVLDGHRRDVPLKVRLKPGENSIAVVKRKEKEWYAFGLFVVERLSKATLIAQFSEQQLTEAEGATFVDARLVAEDDLESPCCTVSLRCALTKQLPAQPVRGSLCQHLQSFDLMPFVVLQEAAPVNRWRCPVCGQPAFKLAVDLHMQKVLLEARKQDYTTAELGAEGQFRLVRDPVKRRMLKWRDFEDLSPENIRQSHVYNWAVSGERR